MRYQNKRGGRIVLQPIAKPTRDEWSSPLEAITAALELEKTVNQVSNVNNYIKIQSIPVVVVVGIGGNG